MGKLKAFCLHLVPFFRHTFCAVSNVIRNTFESGTSACQAGFVTQKSFLFTLQRCVSKRFVCRHEVLPGTVYM